LINSGIAGSKEGEKLSGEAPFSQIQILVFESDKDPLEVSRSNYKSLHAKKRLALTTCREEKPKPGDEAVNAMLLNEFLKEHREVQKQGETVARLKKQVAALTTGLQKVSAQLELSKSAPPVALAQKGVEQKAWSCSCNKKESTQPTI
jgi:hypothetical protein